jgi:hypothetical protein
MKSIDAIYKFGNLYDRKTRRRVLMEDGAQIAVVINENDLLNEDPNLKPENLLNSADKKDAVSLFISGKGKSWKLLDANQILYFEISAGIKKKTKTEHFNFIFEFKLLEDLYIYNKKSEPNGARFYDCHGIVEKCTPVFDYFEAIYAKSLNDAYTKTYELYFAMFGKSTANSFDRFFLSPDRKEPIRNMTESIQKK